MSGRRTDWSNDNTDTAGWETARHFDRLFGFSVEEAIAGLKAPAPKGGSRVGAQPRRTAKERRGRL